MAGVFISYRREDSMAYAGRLYDRLVARFGEGSVFMDIDTLKPGDDFVDALEQTLSSCDVLVAVIGRNWLTAADDKGQKRLQDSADFVRLEVSTALNRNIRVIPALVAGAQMPRAEDLPEALQRLARRQAVVLSDVGFQESVARLLAAINLPVAASGTETLAPQPRKKPAVFVAAILGALLLAAGGWYFWPKKPGSLGTEQSQALDEGTFSVPELARLYRFPLNFDGGGQTVGFVELGGGYAVSDLDTYFSELKLGPPAVVSVAVDRATNSPGSRMDSVVTSSIEIVGAIAPRAQIVVYFAPNTSDGFIHAIDRATNDTAHRLSILVITWGQPEESWDHETRMDLNSALKAAADRNITTIAATGDLGVADGLLDDRLHVDFPASSPWVLACGGSRLIADASRERIRGEVFLGRTGRGVSQAFDKPSWQKELNAKGRAIPDVVGDATSRYRVFVHGQRMVLGGTTATASLWAGLLALINQELGRNVGFIDPLLYEKLGPGGVLRKVALGTDDETGSYCRSGNGWNPCSGWGSPDGHKLVEALR